MPNNNGDLEKKLWSVADKLHASTKLSQQEYSFPVLGLIFLRFADHKFTEVDSSLRKEEDLGRKSINKYLYIAKGAIYLPENARYGFLMNLPESVNIGKAVDNAMQAIEDDNESLKDVLPKSYQKLENDVLLNLLRTFNSISEADLKGDLFGKIYEYFLSNFAMGEGHRGGEFFTPPSLVDLIVNIVKPYHGRILDPACGSGGMFVHSAKFVENHQKNPNLEIRVYGQEKNSQTIRLAKMNLAVHGLYGDIKQGNTYEFDAHDSFEQFDYVMANPPFNVSGIDREKIKKDHRYPYGMPSNDGGNYLWIQIFYSALKATGRAGFVMSAAAGDAGNSEMEIRKQLIKSGVVDVMVSIGTKFFYTVGLPCSLWFLDKSKTHTERKNTILFIDAREIYRQIDKAHREFTPEQIEFISNITNLYRGENPEFKTSNKDEFENIFPGFKYQDVAGLCKIASIDEVEKQGWSLNPGRYVGVKKIIGDGKNFNDSIAELTHELEKLNEESKGLEQIISQNIKQLLNNHGK